MSEERSRILLVDDNPKNLDVLSELFDQQDFAVLFALDGKSAMQRAESGQPDLILLDVMMPGMNGFDVCCQLKSGTQTQDIPVIFMTALSETADKVKGFQAGAVDYITKPIQPEEVLSRVKTHLALRRLQKQLQYRNRQLQEEIFRRRQAEDELQERNRQLREANASKDTFFSILAHDLRSPLNTLQVFPEMILEHIDEYRKEDIVKYTSKQQDAVKNLAALLDNLLTWSRNQRGMIEYCPQTYRIEDIIARNVALLVPYADKKQVRLTASIPDVLIAYVDPNMIDTVIRNLLSNAVKFTDTQGRIDIFAEDRETDISISVRDTGIGIPAVELPKLFRIDTRFKRSGTAHESGTGLGLILCKEFIEWHGGTIQVESRMDTGSTFNVTIPKKPLE